MFNPFILPGGKPMRSRLAALVGVAFLFLPIQAQDSRAKVQGIVTDASNAVIAGANVQLLNENTGVHVTANTNGSGQYLFDFVIPGTYSVTVELQGFRKYVQKAILVQARGDVTVNAALELGSTRESVDGGSGSDCGAVQHLDDGLDVGYEDDQPIAHYSSQSVFAGDLESGNGAALVNRTEPVPSLGGFADRRRRQHFHEERYCPGRIAFDDYPEVFLYASDGCSVGSELATERD